MSSLTLLLLFCLFLHACYARPLTFVDPKGDIVNANVHNKVLVSSQLGSLISEDLPKQEQQEIKSKGGEVPENFNGVNPITQRVAKGFLKERKEAFQGYKMNIPSQNGLLRAAKRVDLRRRQARLMLSSSPDEIEEALDAKGNNEVEGIVVMDYAQPHRKPPIHNKKH